MRDMSKRIQIVSNSHKREYQGQHRFEHWLVDNQIYFVTARCRDRFSAFASEAAKTVFWERLEFCTQEFGFVPWGDFTARQPLPYARLSESQFEPSQVDATVARRHLEAGE